MERNMEAVRELLEAARHLDEKGILNAIEGNVSLRRDGLIYVTPSGKNKAFLTEDMIAVVDEDGNQLYGSCRPSSELKLHLQVYRTRREVGGVVHAHPTCLAAHAVCGLPIRTKAYAELLTVYGSFEVAPYGRPGSGKGERASGRGMRGSAFHTEGESEELNLIEKLYKEKGKGERA